MKINYRFIHHMQHLSWMLDFGFNIRLFRKQGIYCKFSVKLSRLNDRMWTRE